MKDESFSEKYPNRDVLSIRTSMPQYYFAWEIMFKLREQNHISKTGQTSSIIHVTIYIFVVIVENCFVCEPLFQISWVLNL